MYSIVYVQIKELLTLYSQILHFIWPPDNHIYLLYLPWKTGNNR